MWKHIVVKALYLFEVFTIKSDFSLYLLYYHRKCELCPSFVSEMAVSLQLTVVCLDISYLSLLLMSLLTEV